MEWHENYSIGVEHIDTQHKKLFNILGRLKNSLVEGEQSKEIANSLCFLVSYTKTHFHDEEEMMLAIDFEEYEHQKELHQKFVGDIKKILEDIQKGKNIGIYGMIDFLMDWLQHHILYEDKKIGKAMAQKKFAEASGATTIVCE